MDGVVDWSTTIGQSCIDFEQHHRHVVLLRRVAGEVCTSLRIRSRRSSRPAGRACRSSELDQPRRRRSNRPAAFIASLMPSCRTRTESPSTERHRDFFEQAFEGIVPSQSAARAPSRPASAPAARATPRPARDVDQRAMAGARVGQRPCAQVDDRVGDGDEAARVEMPEMMLLASMSSSRGDMCCWLSESISPFSSAMYSAADVPLPATSAIRRPRRSLVHRQEVVVVPAHFARRFAMPREREPRHLQRALRQQRHLDAAARSAVPARGAPSPPSRCSRSSMLAVIELNDRGQLAELIARADGDLVAEVAAPRRARSRQTARAPTR